MYEKIFHYLFNSNYEVAHDLLQIIRNKDIEYCIVVSCTDGPSSKVCLENESDYELVINYYKEQLEHENV